MQYFVLAAILLLSNKELNAQKSDLDFKHRDIIVKTSEEEIYAQILTDEKNIRIEANVRYSWYSNNMIMTTQGGYDGYLLDGQYVVKYPNYQLKETGCFKKGQKHGSWVRWNTQGNLVEMINWKYGFKHGIYKLYDENGNLEVSGRYVKGDKDGFEKRYRNGDVISKVKYEDGKIVEPKVKGSRDENAEEGKVKKENEGFDEKTRNKKSKADKDKDREERKLKREERKAKRESKKKAEESKEKPSPD